MTYTKQCKKWNMCWKLITWKLLTRARVIFFLFCMFPFYFIVVQSSCNLCGGECSWADLSLQYCTFTAGHCLIPTVLKEEGKKEKKNKTCALRSSSSIHQKIKIKSQAMTFNIYHSQSTLPSFPHMSSTAALKGICLSRTASVALTDITGRT